MSASPIVDIALLLRRSLQIWSPLGANVLWTLFQPWHRFELTVLPERQAAPAEQAAAQAAEAAQSIAASLRLSATEWSTAAKSGRSREAKLLGKRRWLEEMRAQWQHHGS